MKKLILGMMLITGSFSNDRDRGRDKPNFEDLKLREEYLKNEKTATIEDIYRKKTSAVDRKTPIMEICLLMVNKGFTRIYVVENGKYYGTILRSLIIKKVLHI